MGYGRSGRNTEHDSVSQKEPNSKCIYNYKSKHQRIRIYEDNKGYKILKLDDEIQFHQKDEEIYHKGIIHPVNYLSNLTDINVLIIGGGDGGVIRELTKFNNVKHIDIVEIDVDVITVCKKYFPSMTKSFDDPRVTLHIDDGHEWLKRKLNDDTYNHFYDMIIMDLTEDGTLSSPLNSMEFLFNCKKCLTPNGFLIRNGIHKYPEFFTYQNYYYVRLSVFGKYFFSMFNDVYDYSDKKQNIYNINTINDIDDCCACIIV